MKTYFALGMVHPIKIKFDPLACIWYPYPCGVAII